MGRISQIIESESYSKMSPKKMIGIAKKEFKTFDNDDLKIRFLEEVFKKYPKERLGNMTAKDAATLLVELGTYEGCQ